jgi:hypothetical protein
MRGVKDSLPGILPWKWNSQTNRTSDQKTQIERTDGRSKPSRTHRSSIQNLQSSASQIRPGRRNDGWEIRKPSCGDVGSSAEVAASLEEIEWMSGPETSPGAVGWSSQAPVPPWYSGPPERDCGFSGRYRRCQMDRTGRAPRIDVERTVRTSSPSERHWMACSGQHDLKDSLDGMFGL